MPTTNGPIKEEKGRKPVMPPPTPPEMEHFDDTQVTNEGADAISFEQPYSVEVTIVGSCPILFHRWNDDSVEAKAKAPKGSKAKKTDDVQSYVYRDKENYICMPGEYLRQSIIGAAKFAQDPRSPRKSAQDLFKAGLIAIDDLCSLGRKDWDYLDRRRVLVQRNGITRLRPAFTEWSITCRFTILLPEYINSHLLADRLQAAGRLIGVGDRRPTNGRFTVSQFSVLKDLVG